MFSRVLATTMLMATAAPVALISQSALAEGVVNIYSARHYDVDEKMYSTFEEQTGIKVNLIEGKEDELIERMKAEGENSPADVFVTADAGRLWRADQAELLSAMSAFLRICVIRKVTGLVSPLALG